jgi:carboxymethylenebutenolidase
LPEKPKGINLDFPYGYIRGMSASAPKQIGADARKRAKGAGRRRTPGGIGIFVKHVSSGGYRMRRRKFCATALVATAVAVLSISAAHAETTNVMVGVKQNMRASLITPAGNGPFPAILLLHTSGGLRQEDIDYGQRLAREGYVVLVPAFLEAYGISSRGRQETFTTAAEPIYADLLAALDMLKRDPRVAGSKLGAIGFSNGGYFAIWLAATGKVQAGISYYGALSGGGSDRELNRFKGAFNNHSSPVLILHGTDDRTVPIAAAEHLNRITAGAGSPHEFHPYDGAGHEFDRSGSSQDKAAAADAWQRTLAFFGKYLKQP